MLCWFDTPTMTIFDGVWDYPSNVLTVPAMGAASLNSAVELTKRNSRSTSNNVAIDRGLTPQIHAAHRAVPTCGYKDTVLVKITSLAELPHDF